VPCVRAALSHICAGGARKSSRSLVEFRGRTVRSNGFCGTASLFGIPGRHNRCPVTSCISTGGHHGPASSNCSGIDGCCPLRGARARKCGRPTCGTPFTGAPGASCSTAAGSSPAAAWRPLLLPWTECLSSLLRKPVLLVWRLLFVPLQLLSRRGTVRALLLRLPVLPVVPIRPCRFATSASDPTRSGGLHRRFVRRHRG